MWPHLAIPFGGHRTPSFFLIDARPRGCTVRRRACMAWRVPLNTHSGNSAGRVGRLALSFLNSTVVVSCQPCPVALARLRWLCSTSPGTQYSVQGDNTLALEDASPGWNPACSEGIATLKASSTVRSQKKKNSYVEHCPIRLHKCHFFIGR